jgi:hypothetical protein
MTAHKHFVLCIILLAISHKSFSQDYPVHASIAVNPPYSVFLSDYATDENYAIQVALYLGDLERDSYKVKFRLTIEGPGIVLTTKPNFIPPPSFLEGGMTEILSGADLAVYFNPDNLDFSGVSRGEFLKRGMLPQGFYTFSLEVLDFSRGIRVSNVARTTAWLILNDPPIINFPLNGDRVMAGNPQNVLLSWTPRHSSMPNGEFGTAYEIIVVEMVGSASPEIAIRTQKPILHTETAATNYLLTVGDPALIPGRKYAFRVRAIDTRGRNLFKNEGYSETFSFIFGHACASPSGLAAKSPDKNRIRLSWDADDVHTGYSIRYAPLNENDWSEVNVESNSTIIPGLTPASTYRFQVQPRCGTLTGDYSDVFEGTTEDNGTTQFACGKPSSVPAPGTVPLDKDLQGGETIMTCDFEVTLTTVAKNADNTFRGSGYAFMPWLNETAVAVKFTKIRVNQERIVYAGNIHTVYTMFSKNAWKVDLGGEHENGDEADATSGLPDSIPEIHFEGIIDSLVFDQASGSIIVYSGGGQANQIPRPEAGEQLAEETRIVDSAGNSWVVDDAGTVSAVSPAYNPGVSAAEGSVDYQVTFNASEKSAYGFDDGTPPASIDEITTNGKPYLPAWKSVPVLGVDKVVVQVPDRNSFPAEVGFDDNGNTVEIHSPTDGSEKIMYVAGHSEPGTRTITAFANAHGDKKIEVGKINVATYRRLSSKLVVVPVNSAPAPDAGALEAELNAIYRQAVAEWEVRVTGTFSIDSQYVAGIDSARSDWLSGFNQSMKRFNRAYQWDNNLDADAYYIFLLKESGSSRAGFMPFKRRFGYVFVENVTNVARVIAHELGHGAFGFQHTFEEFNLAKGSTRNLMDYGGGISLARYQWDAMRDPKNHTGWISDAEETSYIEFESEFSKAVAPAGAGCWSDGVERGFDLFENYDMDVALYGGFIRMLLCETEKQNCGESGVGDFACGITNGLLQEIDWCAFLETAEGLAFNPAELLTCMYRTMPKGTGPGIEEADFTKIVFKCITGVELGDMVDGIKQFVVENWDEPYYQGQATAFALTLFSPLKGKILAKLRTLPKFASKIAKFENLALAKNGDELVGIAKSMITKARSLTFKPSWLPDRVITGNLDNPKGLIGVYNKTLPDGSIVDDTKRALADLQFDETYASNFESFSKDGFKMLNTNKWYYMMDEAGYWENFNKPWLDDLVRNKADVQVLSDKNNDLLKYVWDWDIDNRRLVFRINKTTGQRLTTGFGREIEYFEKLLKDGQYAWESTSGVYYYIGK